MIALLYNLGLITTNQMNNRIKIPPMIFPTVGNITAGQTKPCPKL
ncbi:hypothetical protein J809_2350 [Acinetobacter sp. 25977_6]|nr:hypothetical protein J811_3735 [Acinetobacter sp. 25977_8]EXT44372.1 hypothetical protein J809_2350 [Acinetobacter sp. 25977_6]EXT44374.1 hypothetical protein J807_3904 [Acinetobacter sp. 25977_4]EXT50456.1 hypothetical protein J806_3900 [Acinetobacter sp. 25977_3]EXT56865.1 hypothetical protein J804_3874 [Acinetobacter sp. 25977_1]EXT65302.1 hypothetical protein J813_3709 [Acinetobacter sp. 25977_10]KCZ29060.1 hypothetical protein J812_3694 [Acinetobacter baumannii 25977_9]